MKLTCLTHRILNLEFCYNPFFFGTLWWCVDELTDFKFSTYLKLITTSAPHFPCDDHPYMSRYWWNLFKPITGFSLLSYVSVFTFTGNIEISIIGFYRLIGLEVVDHRGSMYGCYLMMSRYFPSLWWRCLLCLSSVFVVEVTTVRVLSCATY